MSDRVLRPLTVDDLSEARRLGAESFGPWTGPYPYGPDDWPFPGRHYLGVFEGPREIAQVLSREYHSWWHGTEVATNGIAGVSVQAEERGSGLLRDLLATTLEAGLRERGEVLSTLYPTAAGIYRGFGYEIVGTLDTVELPVSALVGLPDAPGVRVRRAEVDDVPAVRALYDRWAAQHNGPLTRRGPSFPTTDAALLESLTGLTIAEDDGGLAGVCSWRRSPGHGPDGRIEVDDLLATSQEAYRALWRVLGSFSSVVDRVRLRTSGFDVARLCLPTSAWQVVDHEPYMLRVHDVAAALTGRRLATPAEVAFTVAGDRIGAMDGDYVLTVADGVSACERGGPGGPVLHPRGLALLYSGAQPCGAIRDAGLMTGPAEQDAVLDAVLGARRVHVRDYF